MLAIKLLFLCLLANCCTCLPVIFGYQSPHLSRSKSGHQHHSVDCDHSASSNDLFVASVNQAIQRPIALKDNSITYNENVDRANYIPVELDSQQEELPADQDFHSSYRRLVTRTIKDAPHYRYPLEDIPIFEYQTSTTEMTPKMEECFENSRFLPRVTIKKMNKRRRKLAQSIRRLNKLQRTYCLTTRRPKQKSQTRCSAWRDEKMVLYMKMLRLTHCAKGRSNNK